MNAERKIARELAEKEDALEAHQHMVEAANRYNHAAAALGKSGVRID